VKDEDGKLLNKKRKRRQEVAARVVKEAKHVAYRPGVQPLNPGHFQLEAMRNKSVAKNKAAVRRQARGR
jgi:hypothetical protein